MQEKVLTLDEELALTPAVTKAVKTPKVKVIKELKEKKKKAYKKPVIETFEEKMQKVKASETKNISGRLTTDVNNFLNYKLTKLPQYKTLTDQIELLKKELQTYKTCGDEAKLNECTNLIEVLILNRKELKDVFKNKTKLSPKDEAEVRRLFAEDEELNGWELERKTLDKSKNMHSPAWLVQQLKEFREQIEIRKHVIGDSDYSVFEDVPQVMDLDSYLSTEEELSELETLNIDNEDDSEADEKELMKNDKLKQEYSNFCGYIGDLIGLTAKEVSESSLNKIKLLLVEFTQAEFELIKEKLNKLKFDINQKKAELRGETTITDILFDVFDFEENDGQEPKEILIAANLNLVKAVAYNTCSRLNQLHNMDDAISYGLIGLTVAANKWLKTQKLIDSPLSFKGFATIEIVNIMQRGLYELTNNGASGSSLATIATRNKARYEKFVKYNDEFDGLDKSKLIENLAEVSEVYSYGAPLNIVTASDYSATVGGEDGGDSSDIFANATGDKSLSNDAELFEAKDAYNKLLGGIKELFGLFKTKSSNKEGFVVKEITEQKLFDKYDFKIFKLVFGFEVPDELELKNLKSLKGGNTKIQWTFIANELTKFAKSEGDINPRTGEFKTFTPPAIHNESKKDGRYDVMMKKIKMACDENKNIRAAFEYIYNYMRENNELLDYTFKNYRNYDGFEKTPSQMIKNIDDVKITDDFKDNQQYIDENLLVGEDAYQIMLAMGNN